MVPEAHFYRTSPAGHSKPGRAYHRSETGQPDITGCHRGRYIALEVKRPKATQSQGQVEFQARIERMGGIYAVVHSVEETQAVIAEVAG